MVPCPNGFYYWRELGIVENTVNQGSPDKSAARRRQAALLATGMIICGAAAGWWQAHDAALFAGLALAAGLVWSSRSWKAWALAVPMALLGVAWSAMDTSGLSIGSRVRLAYEKVIGHLPYLGWRDLAALAVSERYESSSAQQPLEAAFRKLEDGTFNGKACERYQTPLGKFWIAAPGRTLLKWIVWEISGQKVYQSGAVSIRPGDTVIDGGAHVGLFSRWALQQGARRVIAIEPEPTNIAMFEQNLADGIADGRVTLVKAGIWDRQGSLPLFLSANSAHHNFLVTDDGGQVAAVPLLPLDDLVRELQLDRVDFIKMDIEGAERNALLGARETLQRFRPRMVICTYHRQDDADAVPAAVAQAQPGYRIHAKDAEFFWFRYLTKTLFFEPPARS